METLSPTKMIEITPELAGYKNNDYEYYVISEGNRFTLKKEVEGYIFRSDTQPGMGWSGWHRTKKDCVFRSIGPQNKVYAWPIQFSKPKSNIAEVLLTLIQDGNVSIKDKAFGHLSGFRTRISDLTLKHGLQLETKMEKDTNKFGNSYSYAVHILPESQKEYAIELYNKINR